MRLLPTFSEAFFAIAFCSLVLVIMAIDDSKKEQFQQEETKAEAIKQAKAEAAERKREFNRMAFEAQRITGFQAAMK